MKKSDILKTVLIGILILFVFAFTILNLFGWQIGLLLGQRDYEVIIALEERYKEDETDTDALNRIIKRTKSRNDLTRSNAISVLARLSSERRYGKDLHPRSIPVFLRGLSDETQSVVKVSLRGFSNLGVYGVDYIPEIRAIADQHEDAYLRDRARDTLERLQKAEKRNILSNPVVDEAPLE